MITNKSLEVVRVVTVITVHDHNTSFVAVMSIVAAGIITVLIIATIH